MIWDMKSYHRFLPLHRRYWIYIHTHHHPIPTLKATSLSLSSSGCVSGPSSKLWVILVVTLFPCLQQRVCRRPELDVTIERPSAHTGEAVRQRDGLETPAACKQVITDIHQPRISLSPFLAITICVSHSHTRLQPHHHRHLRLYSPLIAWDILSEP